MTEHRRSPRNDAGADVGPLIRPLVDLMRFGRKSSGSRIDVYIRGAVVDEIAIALKRIMPCSCGDARCGATDEQMRVMANGVLFGGLSALMQGTAAMPAADAPGSSPANPLYVSGISVESPIYVSQEPGEVEILRDADGRVTGARDVPRT